ncbi:MAG: YIP1 family protein [Candidatus Eisenbacteria bacterium]|nr:YIP1 family protein [Candidatus Eisenbacteria bacterium]
MTAIVASRETRPINPLAALTLVLVFPGKTFRRLVERPHWILPLVFVAASIILSSLLGLAAGLMDDVIVREAFLSGSDPEAVRAGTPTAMIVSGVVGVVAATLLQTLFYIAIARLFGGRGRFRVAFSAVCHASVPVGVVAILMTAIIPFTRSADVGASLTFLLDPARQPLLWGFASQIDIAVIWFFVLLGIAAEPVFELDRRRARGATTVFAAVSILTLGWLAGRQAGLAEDPHAGWESRESAACVLHFPAGTPDDALTGALASVGRSFGRVESLTGLGPVARPVAEPGPADGRDAGVEVEADSRIDCYLYPSLEEKRRVTGNVTPAHRVEWANAVHLATVNGADVYLTRELLKLEDARAHGKMYNPLVRDGLAVFAGGSWGGMSVREAGRDLLERRVLPRLDVLANPVAFRDMDERIAEPAAGSFTGFLVSEVGEPGMQDIYRSSARDPDSVSGLLESALVDSLAGIDDRWRLYLLAETGEPGECAPGEQ